MKLVRNVFKPKKKSQDSWKFDDLFRKMGKKVILSYMTLDLPNISMYTCGNHTKQCKINKEHIWDWYQVSQTLDWSLKVKISGTYHLEEMRKKQSSVVRI